MELKVENKIPALEAEKLTENANKITDEKMQNIKENLIPLIIIFLTFSSKFLNLSIIIFIICITPIYNDTMIIYQKQM